MSSPDTGLPVDAPRVVADDASTPAEPPRGSDARPVWRALALAWTPRHRKWLIDLLRRLECRTERGLYYGQADIDECLASLAVQGWVARSEHGWQCVTARRPGAFRRALEEPDFRRWRDTILAADTSTAQRGWAAFTGVGTAVTMARLCFYGGEGVERWRQIEQAAQHLPEWQTVIDQVVLSGFDPVAAERADPALAAALLVVALDFGLQVLHPALPAVLAHARTRLDRSDRVKIEPLRWRVAEVLLFSARFHEALAIVGDSREGHAKGIRAGVLAAQGQWEAAIAGFEDALATRRLESGGRKRLLPETLAWLYPMSLFATRDPARVAQARKFCVGESGARRPRDESLWSRWAAAADIRLGDQPPDPGFGELHAWYGTRPRFFWADRLMLRAWVLGAQGGGAGRAGGAQDPATRAGARDPEAAREAAMAALRRALELTGLAWLAQQLRAAEQVLAGLPPQPPFFVAGAGDAWRDALAAIAALTPSSSASGEALVGQDTRLLWALHTDDHDRLVAIEALEQKHGARDWNKPRTIAWSRLARDPDLPADDARVARAIKPRRGSAGGFGIDLAEAAAALVGHPRVVWANAPTRFVRLSDDQPDIRLEAVGDEWVLRFEPDLVGLSREASGFEFDAHGAVRGGAPPLEGAVFALPDGDARARLIRLNAAHRRVVSLAAGGLRIPQRAITELQAALPALAAHFRLRADAGHGARQVSASARLRAELSPVGDGVRLRLVSAPLGPGGPRLAPGAGRREVVAPVDGVLASVTRDLAREAEALRAVLERFEALDPPGDRERIPEWEVLDPQAALSLIEALPALEAIEGLDWPSGRSVRVMSAGSEAMRVSVKRDGQWFAIDGEIAIDESRVLALGELIALSRAQRGRFVPLGEDRWLALTDRLRQQIEDLAAVVETPRGPGGEARAKSGEVRAPMLAAQWIDDALADSRRDDRALRERLDELQRVIEQPVAVPSTLQAELRPYQQDGFEWVARRAQAGFGACLADDMGLGKTVQALALLLSRAALGPALVVAPTSVCANWVDEASRFAPGLRTRLYGAPEERETLLRQAREGDLIVVSYTLLQQAADAFGAVRWATLVADEAQAIKNASAKRSQAIRELDADFRLALSGTPIENRLGELWAIMSFVNPGLLGSAQRFTERFVVPIERDRDLRAQRTLRRLIAPFVLRRLKSEVLQDLPERTETVLSVVPDAEERAHYEALRREALSTALAAGPRDRIHVLAQLTRLRRAACDPRLVSPSLGLVGAKVSAFLELARELVANRHKALVFSQFTDFLALLRAPIEAEGIAHQYLDGATSPAERARRVAAFQAGEGELFFISLKAGGFGLNLTAADYVVIVDPWWNPAAEDQATGRAHRLGQNRPVTVYRLVSRGTIEERIVDLHHEKRSLAQGVLEGIEAGAVMGGEELIGLLDGGSGDFVN